MSNTARARRRLASFLRRLLSANTKSRQKEIEVMGTELMDLVKQCEAVTRNALGVTEELKETAGRYREEAKRIFQQIENCSQVTAEVRNICNDLREKIAARNATTKTEQA